MEEINLNIKNAPRMHDIRNFKPTSGHFILYLEETPTIPKLGYYTDTNGFCDLEGKPIDQKYIYWGFTNCTFDVNETF